MVLFDEIIIEEGSFTSTISDGVAIEGHDPWTEKNTKEYALQQINKIVNSPDEDFITVHDGKTNRIKEKWLTRKKDKYFADFRIIDFVVELENRNYDNELDFFKLAKVERKENHRENLEKNISLDIENEDYFKIANKIYGEMGSIQLIYNLYDSLALSQIFKCPISIDELHSPLLKFKTQAEIGSEFQILEKLSKLALPDFSTMSLEDLLEIRKDKTIISFRDWIHQISSRIQSDSTLNLDNFVFLELLEELKEMAPSKQSIGLDVGLGASSLIPGLGTVATVADLAHSVKNYHDFSKSWLSFIIKFSNIRSRTKTLKK